MWQAALNDVVSEEDLRAALRTAVPWEDAFSSPVFLETALAGVGLTQVSVREVCYTIDTATTSFIESRLLSLSSRYMEASQGSKEWARFTEDVSRQLVAALGAHIQFEVAVNIGVGNKPAKADIVVSRAGK